MSLHYIALLYPPNAGSAWGVVFPDLPGCVSGGESFEEAVEQAREALAGHLAVLRADGDDIPKPRSYAELAEDAEFREAQEDDNAIPVPMAGITISAPKERINIMIDRGMLKLVDQAARAEGISRSSFLERAASLVVNPT